MPLIPHIEIQNINIEVGAITIKMPMTMITNGKICGNDFIG